MMFCGVLWGNMGRYEAKKGNPIENNMDNDTETGKEHQKLFSCLISLCRA